MDNNHQHNTTEWVFQKYLSTPLPELRIAAYTLWTTALSKIPNAFLLLFHSLPPTFAAWLQKREITHDAREAKYELVLAFQKHCNHNSNHNEAMTGVPKLPQLLERQVKLGAHGLEPHRWDDMEVQ